MSIAVATKMSALNFSIPAGYDEIITFTVNPAVTPSLVDTMIWWRAWPQQFGIPMVSSGHPVIEKQTPDIVSIDSPLSFTVPLFTADTLYLTPGNYYHEATILNAINEVIGGSWGIMTVTSTSNR